MEELELLQCQLEATQHHAIATLHTLTHANNCGLSIPAAQRKAEEAYHALRDATEEIRCAIEAAKESQ